MSMSSIKSFVQIIRPLNCALGGFSLYVGIMITMGKDFLFKNLFLISIGCIVVFLISAGGFVINDIYDLEIDKINQPQRILPSNKISLQTAWMYAFILFLVGLLLSIYSLTLPATLNVGLLPPIMTVIGIISLLLYASLFKKLGLIGNLVIIGLSTIPFFIGGLVAGGIISRAVFPVLIVLTVQYAREIIKDVDDVKGDVAASDFIINLPTLIGVKKTVLLGRFLLLLTIIITILPFTTNLFPYFKSWGVAYLAVTADIICLYSIVLLTGSDEILISKSKKVKTYLKVAIFFGLIGLALNSFTPIN